MTKIEIIKDNDSIPSDESKTAEPATISFELSDGGEAVFRVPTVRDAKILEKQKPNLSITDTCRELATLCLQTWGDAPAMPDEDDIYAEDDQQLVRLFLAELADAPTDLDDADLLDRYTADAAESFIVLPDKNHQVHLSCGVLVLRRLTRKDIRRIEQHAGKVGSVTGDVLTAASVTASWWRSDRDIMPSDFDRLPLREFRRVSAALQGFLKRSGGSK